MNTANFLSINIYLTQKVEEDMLWNIAVNDAGASYDPLTLLRTRTTFGRPDWMSVYGKMKQAIEIGQYIPGSKKKMKTKVAVRNALSWNQSVVLVIVFRHTSAVPAPWQKLSGRPVSIAQAEGSNSHLPRFVTFQHIFLLLNTI